MRKMLILGLSLLGVVSLASADQINNSTTNHQDEEAPQVIIVKSSPAPVNRSAVSNSHKTVHKHQHEKTLHHQKSRNKQQRHSHKSHPKKKHS